MEISIYQIDMERDKDRVCYLSHDSLHRFQGTSEINSTIYEKVFSGKVDCHNLEGVYTMFNTKIPDSYQGRSLSVSDVVEVISDAKEENGFYYCDSFGFQKVDFSPVQNKPLDAPGKKSDDTEKISVLLVEPGKKPEMIEIENKLEEMQKAVGGYIEIADFFGDGAIIICNEEGKLKGLPFNRLVFSDDNKLLAIIAGPMLIAGVKQDEIASLPPAMAEKYKTKFKNPMAAFRRQPKR